MRREMESESEAEREGGGNESGRAGGGVLRV